MCLQTQHCLQKVHLLMSRFVPFEYKQSPNIFMTELQAALSLTKTNQRGITPKWKPSTQSTCECWKDLTKKLINNMKARTKYYPQKLAISYSWLTISVRQIKFRQRIQWMTMNISKNAKKTGIEDWKEIRKSSWLNSRKTKRELNEIRKVIRYMNNESAEGNQMEHARTENSLCLVRSSVYSFTNRMDYVDNKLSQFEEKVTNGNFFGTL